MVLFLHWNIVESCKHSTNLILIHFAIIFTDNLNLFFQRLIVNGFKTRVRILSVRCRSLLHQSLRGLNLRLVPLMVFFIIQYWLEYVERFLVNPTNFDVIKVFITDFAWLSYTFYLGHISSRYYATFIIFGLFLSR